MKDEKPEDRALGGGKPVDKTITGGMAAVEAEVSNAADTDGYDDLEQQVFAEGDALTSHTSATTAVDEFEDQIDARATESELAQTDYIQRKRSRRRIGGLLFGTLLAVGTALGIYRAQNPPELTVTVDDSELNPIPEGRRYDTSLLTEGPKPSQITLPNSQRRLTNPTADLATIAETRSLTVGGVTVIGECFDDEVYEPVLTTPAIDELYGECDPADDLIIPPTPTHEHILVTLEHALATAEELMQADSYTPPSDVPESERYLTHSVQKGEILSRILKEHTGKLYRNPFTQAMERHVASVSEIENTHWIYTNQEVQLPINSTTHKVAKGDTLAEIAKQYGVDWKQVAHDNQLEIEDREGVPHVHIVPNQELFVFGIDLEDALGDIQLPDTSSTGDGYAMQELSTEFEYLYNLIVSERALAQFESPLFDGSIESDGELDGLVDGMWNHYEESGITIPRTIDYDSRLEAGMMKACDEETVSQFKFYQIANFAGVDENDLREHMKDTCGKTYSDVKGEYVDQRALEVQEAYKEMLERGEAGIVSRLATDYGISNSTIYRDLKRNPLDRMAVELLNELREEPQEPTEDEATEGDGETSDYTLTLGLGGYEHAAEEIREQMDKAA
ncbi:LysM peptidoglycan-binding domain-containing protein [archaeon]|jgi:hypothetical protein|nr:LysM peptidoglycan-binding domain-containing protein [archaeon]MBT4396991.1 LysM peptidoglycan-binding domain-containing protein [archaeon]MBT4440982.1 LysM peptidoglycan-binding domain-containing protein [archaeon]